jgi:thiol:disulfide interchange protein DsbD
MTRRLTLLLTILLAGAAAGQEQDPADIVHTKILSVKAEPAAAKVGETFNLVFKVQVDPEWHIYSANGTYTPTEWTFSGPVERAGKVEEPKPRHHREVVGKDDDGKDIVVEYDYHEGEVTFRVPVRSTGAAKPGPLAIAGKMSGQECDPKVCIPFDLAFSTNVTVAEGGVAAPPAPAPVTPAPSATTSSEAPKGFCGLLALAIIGGLVSLIMPCVYPLLPITLTYFIKQGGESRPKAVAMSTSYALGIILVFTGVGFLFSILLGADGPRLFAANPWVNVGVGLLFLWFAFSLFGLYEITLPSWLMGPATSQQRSGVAGAFILGALFSVVTFTCTIPIAATVLGVAATAGAENRFAGLVAMLVYSATMAAPFFVLGIFPSMLKEVPRSGGWLHTVKVTAGFAELALALMYFAKADQVTETGFLTRQVMIAVWVAVLGFMALYLLGVFRMKEDGPPGPVGLPRILVALSLGVVAAFMGSGFSGKPLGALDILLPVNLEPDQGASAGGGPKRKAIGNYDEALAEARRTGKPIFLEFTGIT